jgi:tetratricopeptide (TPR) repeat protein
VKTLAAIAALAFLALVPVAAPAATVLEDSARNETLDRLFTDLKNAPSAASGRAIEAQIMGIWLQSGDDQIDQQMSWAMQAMDIQAFDLALNYLDNIIVTKPGFAEGWNKRATVYYIVGRYQESIADIGRVLALEPRHFGAIAGLGLVLQRMGDKEKALDAFKRAVEIDPQLTDIQTQIFLLEDAIARDKRGQGI